MSCVALFSFFKNSAKRNLRVFEEEKTNELLTCFFFFLVFFNLCFIISMGVEKVARKYEFRFWFKCIEIHNQSRHAWRLRLKGFWLFCRCSHLDKKRVWRARDGLRCPLLAPPSRGWGDRRLLVSGMHEANDKYSGPFDLKKREREGRKEERRTHWTLWTALTG